MAHAADPKQTTGSNDDIDAALLQRSQEILTPPHGCGIHDGSEEDLQSKPAIGFCFECKLKLCEMCHRCHRNVPVVRHHRLTDLDTLKAEEVAKYLRSVCENDENHPGQRFCPVHREVLCLECEAKHHSDCANVKNVNEAEVEDYDIARREMEELKRRTDAMIKDLDMQMIIGVNGFNKQREHVKTAFDDLDRQIRIRYQEVCEKMEREKQQRIQEATRKADELRRLKDSLATQQEMIEQAINAPTDQMLLSMMANLEPIMKAAEIDMARVDSINAEKLPPITRPPELDPANIAAFKSALREIGDGIIAGRQAATDRTPATDVPRVSAASATASAPSRGAALTPQLAEGDRVRFSASGKRRWKENPGLGTVTAVPSRLVLTASLTAPEDKDPQLHVDVLWDSGEEGCYHMGHNDQYDLELL